MLAFFIKIICKGRNFLMNTYLISQIFGGIAFILGCVACFSKTKVKYLAIDSVVNIFITLSYFFLFSYVAAYISIVSIIKPITFCLCQKYNFKRTYIFSILFILTNLVITIVFWTSPLDIIPLTTSTMFTFVMSIKDIQKTRYFSILPYIIIFTYDIILTAYTNSALTLLTLIITIIAIVKYNKEQSKKSTQNL